MSPAPCRALRCVRCCREGDHDLLIREAQMTRKLQGSALLLAVLLLASVPAWGANGHLLHGVGAVNSAMGGAGVALPNDALGALNLNPALLTQLDGSKFEFSAEYNDAKNAVESSVTIPGVGTFSGRTED